AGSAAFLSVYESAYNLLGRLAAEGYSVERPDSLEAFKAEILAGNADEHGTEANVVAKVPSEDYMRRTPYLEEIEAQWGPAPGRTLTDGRTLLIQGARFGNVLLAIQPAFGYEGDPMRLLFERNHTPTHAFNAFYQYLRQDFGADAVLHFGTHGALEFMPGKQVGLSERCWPDRLIGDLPNYYLYAANNPSEATIAKRRSNAVIISHLTPPLATSGLYRELADLRALLDRARSLSPDDSERTELVVQAKEQASALEVALPTGADSDDAVLDQLTDELRKLEETLIPLGLHTLEATPSRQRSRDYLALLIQDQHPEANDALIDALLDQAPESTLNTLCNEADGEGALRDALPRFQEIARRLLELDELGAIVHALDGGYLEPVSGGDLLRNPDILPTGRNVHGFDPTKLPSTLAVETGRRQADQLLACHAAKTGKPPEMIAMVLWGTDNLKSEGVPIGQALALIGARPRMDSYGRLAGAELIPLAELGRPRVDVLLTLSGIFRDLLPGQIQLLAEAAHLAAVADEPLAENPIRRHALAHAQANGCPLETSTLRVFSNAGGTYGANVNHLIDSGAWDSDDELGAMFSRRKCFAYSMDAKPVEQEALMTSLLADVDLTFQNLDSIELGVTTVDHYFDSLGGISKAVELARGEGVPTYIGDHTQQESVVRTLAEQLTLESRTRLLNPRWYEEMLSHGQEGVHQLHAHVTNTMGWSATTNQVSPWVYEQLTQTFVLDDVMRERLAELNPTASLKLANRLLEARDRDYWHPDDSVLDALRDAEMALEDRLEGLESLQGATP
ncbi:MAG: magnesium chelatase subunit H, partial [Pseudomonadota bacterium]